MGEDAIIGYYKGRAISDLDSFQANGLGDADGARYELLKQEDARHRERRRFLRNVKAWWQYRRKFWKDKMPPASLQHTDRGELGAEPIIAYRPIKLHPEDADYSLLGYKVSLDHVIQSIAAREFEKTFHATANVSVVDDKGRPVYGSRTEDGKPEVSADFPGQFHFLKMYVTENDPQSARNTARKLKFVYTSLNLVIVGVIVAGVYLTLKDMNRELQLTRLKADFVSNVSHELKTPLALIRMFSETLLMGRVKSDARKKEYYDVMTRESERLTALINNVLDFSKIDAGRRTYQMELCCVEDLITNTLGAYRYELSKGNFRVDVDIEPNLPDVLIDGDAISQALLNLLNNAVKYSGGNKEITISAKRRDGTLRLSVTDAGIGIDKENLKQVFDMFYRAKDESVRSTRGTGLGLAITKHTAEAHGGAVLVESSKGIGSTFTIVLPIRQREDRPEEQQEKKQRALEN